MGDVSDYGTLRLFNGTRSISTDLIIGCSPLAGLYSYVDDNTSLNTIKSALELGCEVFDTAPHYGCGLSEQRLGLALRECCHFSSAEYRIYTKVGRVMIPKEENPQELEIDINNIPQTENCLFQNVIENVIPYYNYTTDGVLRSYQDSMRRLGTSNIYGLRLHDCENEHHFQTATSATNGGLGALLQLREEGLIEDVSLGMNSAQYALKLIRAAPHGGINSVMIAGCWNLLDHDITAITLLLECQARGIKVHNAGIFCSGLLAGGNTYKYREVPSEILDRTQRWRELAERFHVALPAVAISFALSPEVVTAISVGVKSSEEVEQAVRWFHTKVPSEIWSIARAEGLLANHVII